MKNNPLVSLLIPTYNQAKFLPRAIQSALDQNYPNLEIIVHDDASTDNTPQVLKQFSDSRLQIIRTKDNHGMLGGWNYIVNKARGEYLKFLASDDLLDKSCVSKLVVAALANPRAALITCQRNLIDQEGNVVDILGFAKQDSVVAGLEHAHWILTDIRANKIGEPTAVLYPKKLLKKAGEYDPTFSQFGDFEYWIRLLAYGELVYLHQPLCSFRIHPASGTSQAQLDGRFITETFRLIDKYYNSPKYRKQYYLTKSDQENVIKQKTLDILKNIKDLLTYGKISRARTYYQRLSKEVDLDYITRMTISQLLKI